MRYRKLDPQGDYTFGQGQNDFYVNSPEAVAQAVLTRLRLLQGEWFLDVTEGTPYQTQILGAHTQSTYDLAVQNRILSTQGVLKLVSYSSSVNAVTRALSVQATIDTIYGTVQIVETL